MLVLGGERCPWEKLRSSLGTKCVPALIIVVVLPCVLLLVFGITAAWLYVRKVKLKYRFVYQIVPKRKLTECVNQSRLGLWGCASCVK